MKQTDLNSLLNHLKIEHNSCNMHIAEIFFCLHVNITFIRELKFRQESHSELLEFNGNSIIRTCNFEVRQVDVQSI